MHYLTPYNTSAVIRLPLVKRASVDLAKQGDYVTPVNGDCFISKDGAGQANPTNNLNIVTGTTWNITLSATELTAKEIIVMVRNNSAVEDQWLTIRTFGNTSAYYGADLAAQNRAADLRQIVGAAVSGPATAGILDVNIKNVNNVVATNNLAADLRQIVGAAVSGPATAGVLDVNIKNVNNAVHNANVGQYGAAVISLANNSITALAFNANAITGAKVASDVDIRNVTGNVAGTVGSVTGNVGAVTGNVGGNLGGNVAGTIAGLTANALKQFFNTNSATNYAASVDGSVVKEIADNAGGASLTADSILSRFNSNLVLADQNINIVGDITGSLSGSVGSVTGNVGAVTGNIGGNVAGSVGSVTGNVAAVTGNVGGNIGGNVVGTVASVVGNVAAVTGNIGGNLAGSVGSVTGNVAAVTGNIGGNIAGTVASVVGNVAAVTGNIGGNLAGSVGSVVGNVAAVTGNVGGNVAGSVGSVVNLNAQLVDAAITTRATPAQVNAEVVDALATDTYVEPGQGAPAATTTLAAKVNYIYKFARNKIEQTNNTLSIYNDAGNVVDQKAAVSDDNTTYTRAEIGSGP